MQYITRFIQSRRIDKQLSLLEKELQRLVLPQELPRRIEILRQELDLLDQQREVLNWLASLSERWTQSLSEPRAQDWLRGLTGSQLEKWAHDWADRQNALAGSLLYNPYDDPAVRVDEAIVHHQQALTVYTRERFPVEWAQTQTHLGRAHLMRTHGQRAVELEYARRYIQTALEVLRPETHREEWGRTQLLLGIIYNEAAGSDRAARQERAIEHFELALTVLTPDQTPDDWATIHNNLGALYQGRISGGQAENIERAIQHIERSLQVYTHDKDPMLWAGAQLNLSNAYAWRQRDDRPANLERALAGGEQALRELDREREPNLWAGAHRHVGDMYHERRQNSADIARAEDYYFQALTVYTREWYPEQWAAIVSSLGCLYSHIAPDQPAHMQRSLQHYEQALTVYTRQGYPEIWATIQRSMALVYIDSKPAADTPHDRAAVSHMMAALDILTPQDYPYECRKAAYELGMLHGRQGRDGLARAALDTAHQAVEALRRETRQSSAKHTMAVENENLYAVLVAACLAKGDIDSAFTYVTASKGRSFVDSLAAAKIDLFGTGSHDPGLAADLQRIRQLQEELDTIRSLLLSERDLLLTSGPKDGERAAQLMRQQQRSDLRDRLRRLQQQEATLWDDISYAYPAFAATQYTSPLSSAQAQSVAQAMNAVLVEYYRHRLGWSAFVVTSESLEHVALPAAADDIVQQGSQWVQRITALIQDNRFGREAAGDDVAGSNDEILQQIDAMFITPLRDHLRDDRLLVLAPFGSLHLLPLSAAQDVQTGAYLLDRYTPIFSPSLSTLHVALTQTRPSNQKSDHQQPRLLSVAYPDAPGSPYYLPNVLPEAAAIAQHFQAVTPLHERQATPGAVAAQASQHEVIHLGCHGWFDLQQPHHSGLLLAQGFLTVQRILTEVDLTRIRLLSIGACFGGRSHVRHGDETIGLAQAMLAAGTQAIAAGLWPIHDEAARQLFTTFYAQVAAGECIAEAMRTAINILRQQSGWSHPYYWAAFQVYGLAHNRLV
jgi:CHAT domain-containing protein